MYQKSQRKQKLIRLNAMEPLKFMEKFYIWTWLIECKLAEFIVAKGDQIRLCKSFVHKSHTNASLLLNSSTAKM